ncbi:MAG: hypothetical protein V1837_06370 [Candidatus Woesearchaeota archaeon]
MDKALVEKIKNEYLLHPELKAFDAQDLFDRLHPISLLENKLSAKLGGIGISHEMEETDELVIVNLTRLYNNAKIMDRIKSISGYFISLVSKDLIVKNPELMGFMALCGEKNSVSGEIRTYDGIELPELQSVRPFLLIPENPNRQAVLEWEDANTNYFGSQRSSPAVLPWLHLD